MKTNSLQSVGELAALRHRLAAARSAGGPTIVISAGTCGQASGANDLIRAAKRELLAQGLAGKVRLRITGCHGFCQMEPSILVEPSRAFYPRVGEKDVARLVAAAGRGELVEDLLPEDPETGRRLPRQEDHGFFRKQLRSLLSLNELVDPIRIHDFISVGGYAALAAVLSGGEPRKVIEEVKASGLRGRGGAGFPTGIKWELLAARSSSGGKFLVCNADEGDPGAYMNRSVLEGNPHLILEGMAIGAYATGATEGVIYVRTEYPLAIRHLEVALRQARGLGLLGKGILGTPFSFDVSLVRGAGAFVCGEETALLRSIEGKVGEPRQRPPFPVERGIDGRPTAINNVETWANVPRIVSRGAAEFARTGTEKSRGTKIFSLVGKIRNTGLVEVPMGIPLREVLFDIGGGPPNGGAIKAVQTGGPSGGCVPARLFDLPVDYESLVQAGTIMGSGGMIVMDDHTCMVDVARYFMNFLQDESCGKCFSCRKGTQRMFEILDDISKGRSSVGQLDLLRELAEVVRDSSMCGLGQTAPNPVLSTLRYFREEFLEHIEKKRCPAGVCKALITYGIGEACDGCGACAKACPEKAISGSKKKRHAIDAKKCSRCGACTGVCPRGAVEVR